MRTNVVAEVLMSLMKEHLQDLRVHHYSPNTLRIRRHLLSSFCAWCGEAGMKLNVQVTKADIEHYQAYLYQYRKRSLRHADINQPLTIRGQQMRLCAVRVFMVWLAKMGLLPCNPAAEIDVPREHPSHHHRSQASA
jgi:integrase/recombinase XerD